MKIVIAPDKFKGCLSAGEVADAIAAGLRRVDPSVHLDVCPMADGGEGTVKALAAATGGKLITRPVTGPLPEMKADATFAILGDGQTAVIEMAAASGLHLLKPEQRNPMKTTTYGTGELLMAAAEMGVKRIILGIGGSATIDAGLGCAQACGLVIVSNARDRLEPGTEPLTGRHLACTRLDLHPPVHRLLPHIDIMVACDVTSPLYGPNGAAAIFGPQKGATPEDIDRFDHGMKSLTAHLNAEHLAHTPGAGAAGGLGFGVMAFFHAKLRSGIDIVIEATRLQDRLKGADLCLTGEGQLDAQSLRGKTPIGIAHLCRQMNVPCIALAGSVGGNTEGVIAEGMAACFSICNGPMAMEQAMHDAPRLLADLSASLLRAIQCCREKHA